MDYFETTYQDLFPIFSKEGYFLCTGVFPTGVTNLSWRNHFKYTWNWHSCLKILQISFSQLSFVTSARVYETLHHLKQKVLKKKKSIEQWSDTIHTSIKTDFHSWFIYYLVLKNCNQQPNISLKVQWEDLRNRQNNNKLEHIINISNKDWWINIIFFWGVVIFLVSSLSFLLFTLLLDKWGSFPEPACCDTNLRSSLVTCLLPRIFRNTWTQQPGLGFYGSEMHTDEHTHTHRHTNAFINTHL